MPTAGFRLTLTRHRTKSCWPCVYLCLTAVHCCQLVVLNQYMAREGLTMKAGFSCIRAVLPAAGV